MEETGKMSRDRYNGHSPTRGLVRLADYLNHRRIVLFWIVSITGLAAPWLVRAVDDRPGGTLASGMLSCEVASIYDGDTMRVRCDGKLMKIRLYCIDAPEMGQKPWGRESRDYLRTITPKQVMVREVTKDRYGRTVGEVFVGGANLNLSLVRAGHAVEYDKYCRDGEYHLADAAARAERIGVWSQPGIQQTPWEYRRR